MTKKGKVYDHVADFRRLQKKGASRWNEVAFPDIWLMLVWLSLAVVGMVMVTSASMPEAVSNGQSPYHYTIRQGGYYVFAAICAYLVFYIPTAQLQIHSAKFLLFVFLLLLALYIPGLGVKVGGSRRWLNLGVVNLQVAEVAKLAIIIFVADYLQRYGTRLKNSWRPLLMLLTIAAVFAFMLLRQPDFGSTAIVMVIVLTMIFLAGASLKRLGLVAAVVFSALVVIMLSKGYRLERLDFLDPWANRYGTGYQLVNAQIAIGNGKYLGLGLGESIQKHQFLPEAHTDFIFAIITEETGLLGALVVMTLFAVLVWRAFAIGLLADKVRKRFASHLSYGIGFALALQALINIGVTIGMLPTKGLTLPLVSYGGSSVVMTFIALAILLRVDAESRYQAQREGLL